MGITITDSDFLMKIFGSTMDNVPNNFMHGLPTCTFDQVLCWTVNEHRPDLRRPDFPSWQEVFFAPELYANTGRDSRTNQVILWWGQLVVSPLWAGDCLLSSTGDSTARHLDNRQALHPTCLSQLSDQPLASLYPFYSSSTTKKRKGL